MDRIAATIERYGMLAAGRRIGVAVSGGADSVFLLHALHEAGLAAAVLHVNHRLRGAESDADEAFVRDLALRFQLPAHVLDAPVATGNMEQEARRARYEFFTAQIGAGNCDAVATGRICVRPLMICCRKMSTAPPGGAMAHQRAHWPRRILACAHPKGNPRARFPTHPRKRRPAGAVSEHQSRAAY